MPFYNTGFSNVEVILFYYQTREWCKCANESKHIPTLFEGGTRQPQWSTLSVAGKDFGKKGLGFVARMFWNVKVMLMLNENKRVNMRSTMCRLFTTAGICLDRMEPITRSVTEAWLHLSVTLIGETTITIPKDLSTIKTMLTFLQ